MDQRRRVRPQLRGVVVRKLPPPAHEVRGHAIGIRAILPPRSDDEEGGQAYPRNGRGRNPTRHLVGSQRLSFTTFQIFCSPCERPPDDSAKLNLCTCSTAPLLQYTHLPPTKGHFIRPTHPHASSDSRPKSLPQKWQTEIGWREAQRNQWTGPPRREMKTTGRVGGRE